MAEDMQHFLTVNRDMTRKPAVVPQNSYRGEQTTIAEIAMSFYDIVRIGDPVSARERAVTLQEQPGIELSPLMHTVLNESQQA
jgi:hypothetical protein